jgi:glycosyltransferase involved in cell wall biosynthesis
MSIGVVAIGRNEGERLRVCLGSALRDSKHVVYVDSGSSDGSVGMAKQMGANVVELDLSIPFTAARARNAGFEKLLQVDPQIEFVQFVDGDCEIVAGWIERAVSEMTAKAQAAVVCGRRRERFPEASVYNMLCDVEWNTPVGKVRACGGDALIRVAAFRAVHGYDESLIAGEEPEMCVRLRADAWEIWRIDAEMTLHDAAMTRFGQWWKRNVRGGHAYAEGYAMHGAPPERQYAKQVRSILIWGLVLPVAIAIGVIVLAIFSPRWCWLPVLAVFLYPLLIAKVARYMHRQRKLSPRTATIYAMSVTLAKWPQLQGIGWYWRSRFSGKKTRLIEYKNIETPGPAKV